MKDINKVFVIGRNKTGTTTMYAALEQMGLALGSQDCAEKLVDDWLNRDFRRIIEYCKGAEAFQDVPFSLNYTYIVMDYAFPGSKFILTVRDTEEWYRSVLNFHFGFLEYDGDVESFIRPDCELISRLKEYSYVRQGWVYDLLFDVFGLTQDLELYDQSIFKLNFDEYNREVKKYFSRRPSDLLVLDVGREIDTSAIAEFLGLPSSSVIPMPHENKGEYEATTTDGVSARNPSI